MKAPVKPQTTEWIDEKNGPPYQEFTFHYRSRGISPPCTELMTDKLQQLGLISQERVLEKEERSEYNKGKETGDSVSGGRSFWSFWSK
jgi:hypothetical protein